LKFIFDVLAYLKGIQDLGVFVSTVFSILTLFGQTVVVYQSYNAGLWGPPSDTVRFVTQTSRFVS